MSMEFEVTGGDQLRELARDFAAIDATYMKKQTMRAMTDTVKPIVPKMRAKVLAFPGGQGQRSVKSREKRPRGLRDATARGIQVKTSLSGRSAGMRIRVDPRHFPEGQKNLPKYLDGQIPGFIPWRHPKWGRRNKPWAVQQTHPYFMETIQPEIPRVNDAMVKVLTTTRDALAVERTKVM